MPDGLSISELLFNEKLLTEDQLEKIKLEVASSGEPEETVLQKFGISEEQVVKAKGELFNIPYVNLNEVGAAPEVLEILPKLVAERFSLIPFVVSADGKELSVAFANPFDPEAIEFAETKSGRKIKAYISLPAEIKKAIDERYGQNLTTEVSAALKESAPSGQTKTMDITTNPELIRKEPIAKIVSTILEFAIRYRASDVHIEPEEDKTRVRYRIDGVLHEKLVLPKNVHDALVSRIKVLTDMKIDEKRVPQDGRFNFKTDGQEVDLRVSSLPTVYGEKIVMRLLKKSGGVPTMQELGLRGRALKNLEDAILRPHGIILICGPTGSGKTTTLYSVLSKINITKVNIITLEDPVEYKIAGVNQVQINPGAGLTFASGLRSFLRQDPNIIMVGEIRDRETTDLAIQASLTGHLVFSTIHTKSASQSLPRLLDMGAEAFLLASTLTAIVAQRICRKICNACKETYEPGPEVTEDIKKTLGQLYSPKQGEKFLLSKGKGCQECNNTGYFGRIGVFEVLPVTEKIARLVTENTMAMDIEKTAVSEGMITLKQDGYLKAVEGITTLEEVLRVAQD
ncbi:type II secretion system protein GspE [Candidatus Shapirobacteria bacterium CG09_land_8_20_14_0_10_39_12]|uniref:Type II secretion system protein GspE n=1 Tax=Candidatus Shapirobacteria bacterium CG09_land_8_20_14_0_10_39_12 TaxID=1974885 RepID=A0A2H0WRS0_9BACT|nr:MAG: type II secretion system protein GspE [Candidatus Shapirobacteria bacterium CG09_land_8_20_14_0_10_39_12]